ncbi:serine hydrolase [Streptomyces sp. FH025]|uniref:serine hydrolase domain-containing protein n=1 Tax=Streptomyces sp. FH025 TaxID=2815937 RepID=UPI001A9E72E2|nr:serine hydrolase domain-containing protein [Streptomyces sp. FH025]MBO1418148.1 beta-lactamase family protein [Streptomyces sp. FH025]
MARRTVSALVGAVLCLALAAPVASATAAEPTAAGSAAVAKGSGGRWVEALKAVTGAGAASAVAEVREEGGVRRAGSGVADLATGAPVRTDGRFRAGSITKVFTSTTVLQLVGEGRIGLDDPIDRYLPGAVPNGDHITVRQLLNHSSGLWDPTNEKGGLFPDRTDGNAIRNWLDQGGLTRTITPAKVVAASVAHAPNFPPGTKWSYSNVNYTLLGMIIERVTGHGYAQEITARILRPLRMSGTYFPGTAIDIRGPHAHGYWTLAEGPGPEDRSDRDVTLADMSWANSAGELISTLDDLTRFEKALLGGRLLSEKLMREMTTTIPVEVDGVPTSVGYGLGLVTLPLSCGPVYGHDGGVPGYSSQLWGTGDRQVAVSATIKGDEAQINAQLGAEIGLVDAAFCGSR